jgi:ribose transport system substrate-binding protein
VQEGFGASVQQGLAQAEAAKVVGLKFVEFKNEGNPSQWVAGMNQAIGQKVDLIILEGSPDPRALTVRLAEAKSSGNPSHQHSFLR